MHPLKEMLLAHKAGSGRGVFSVCSANELVIVGSMRHAKRWGYPLVVEATSNQVNQMGGYTGMTPKDYAELVARLAHQEAFPLDQLILGGDHLGPIPWKAQPEAEAMRGASDMVYAYARAGYTKIHLDTSMRLGDDDPHAPLSTETVARRGALLALAAMRGYQDLLQEDPSALRPVLIIGSEVPIPGGSQEHEDSVEPTRVADFEEAAQVFRRAFDAVNAPFDDVIAFVVQPGVEFGDDFVCQYDRAKARPLTEALGGYPTLLFEGHSTDYQTRERLREMVEDGIAILKVGPALTFAVREALMLLEQIEREITTPEACSGFMAALEAAMDENPTYWQPYYSGSAADIAYKKRYSYSDRCRYYLPAPSVRAAQAKLLKNLDRPIPPALVSLYFRAQYEKAARGQLPLTAEALLMDRLSEWLDDYRVAIGH